MKIVIGASAAAIALTAGAAAQPAPRIVIAHRAAAVTASTTVAVRGRVTSGPGGQRLRLRLEQIAGRRWSTIATSTASRDRHFTLRWRAPANTASVRLRIRALSGARIVARSPSWRVTVREAAAHPTVSRPPIAPTSPFGSVVSPGGVSNRPPTAPAPSGPTPVAPTPPAVQTVYDVPAMKIASGTDEPAPLPESVSVTQVGDAAPLASAAQDGVLHLAATAGLAPDHHELQISATGCVNEQCGLALTIRVPVDVVSPAAPPGAVSEFPSPSADRLQTATPLPTGLPGRRLTDELVITLGTDLAPGSRSDADADAAAVQAVVTGGVDSIGVFSIGWTAPQDLAARRQALLARPGITAVTFRDVGTVDGSALPPGDWADDGQDVTWPFTQINAQAAWDLQQGGLVKLGIVDVGAVQVSHEDLNVVTKLSTGAQYHSTHVAGLACARANGKGVVGVAWGCPIVSSGIKTGSDEDVLAAAVSVALEPGVKVVNMSLGPNLDTPRCATQSEHDARILAGQTHAVWFRRLFNGAGKDIVWTIAAGNNCEDAAPSPMAQNGELPNVLVVAATNSDRSLARFSTFGLDVKVAAPGGVDVEPPRNGTVGLWSTWHYGDALQGRSECGPAYHYCWLSGTSMAAPMVAGVAELIRSAFPGYSAGDVADCIVRTAAGGAAQSAFPTSYSPKIPFTPAEAVPIVDADAALRCKPGQFSVTIGDGTPINARLHQPLSITLTAAGGRAPYTWSLDGITAAIDGLSLTSAGVLSGTPTYAGDLAIPVRLTDAAGNVATATINVKVAFGTAPPISGKPLRLTAGNGDSRVMGISGDGALALFTSRATDLTPDAPRTTDGSDLFIIDTANTQRERITRGTGDTDWALMSSDASTAVFRSTATDLVAGSDPNGAGEDLYLWRRAGGVITRVAPGIDAPAAISDDGSRVLFTAVELGQLRYRVVNTVTGQTSAMTTDPSLQYSSAPTLSGDGTKLLYTAAPTGSNLVPFIHVRDLISNTDTNFGVQSTGALRFAANATEIVYGTFHGFFNEGTAVLNVATQQQTALDGGVNGVFFAMTPSLGSCIVLHSWENTSLTADLPNRGDKVFYDDLFSYNLQAGTYQRLTNTYDVDTSGSGVAVANDCSVVAFDLPPGAVDPDQQAASTPRDVWVRRP